MHLVHSCFDSTIGLTKSTVWRTAWETPCHAALHCHCLATPGFQLRARLLSRNMFPAGRSNQVDNIHTCIVLLDSSHLLESRHDARQKSTLEATAGYKLLPVQLQIITRGEAEALPMAV